MSRFPSHISLQATLAASTAWNGPGHHPVTCRKELLWLEEDGRMGCEHGEVPADDPHTQYCVDHSIAILLIELMVEREEAPGDGRP